jgi:cytochrome c peroxidase
MRQVSGQAPGLAGRWFLLLWALLPLADAAAAAAAGAAAMTVPLDASSPTAFEWQLPPGFPVPWVPADNPMSIAKVALGARLFQEPRLSISGAYACVSCHNPRRAYTDGRARSVGATGEQTRRSAMSLANVAYNAAYTWGDASVDTLEVQMLRPLLNEHPVELGLSHRQAPLIAWLLANDEYRIAFATAFPGEDNRVSLDNLIKAIAAFERTLISGRSAFDRYVFDGDSQAMPPAAKRGMALFYSARAGCAQCHFGLTFAGPIRSVGSPRAAALFANTGLYDLDGRGAYPDSDRGLMEVTHRDADNGKMRVPTLRNVAITAPFMHDGSIATLAGVIDHYAMGGKRQPQRPASAKRRVDRRVRPLALTAADKLELLAFLASLTDQEFIAAPLAPGARLD